MKLVRALYDFTAHIAGDISLRKGDLVVVTAAVNADWLCGWCNDKEGNFPANFVEDVPVPQLQYSQVLFVGKQDFVATHAGDLGFKKGDIVIGLEQVDANWWKGQSCNGSSTGIFPVTHAEVLPLVPGSSVRRIAEGREAVRNASYVAVSTAAHGGSQVRRDIHGGSSSNGLFRVRAQLDAVAQLAEELSFRKEDIITVTRVVDDDWYYGECHGRHGMFLSSLVERLTLEEAAVERGSIGDLSAGQSDLGTVSAGVTTGAAVGSGGAAALSLTGPALQENGGTEADDALLPQCRALYSFTGQDASELCFAAGDIIAGVHRVDGSWCRGRLGARSGLFPASYVSFLNDVGSRNVEDKAAKVVCGQAINKGDPKGGQCQQQQSPAVSVVLYDFQAAMPNEISVSQGDAVIVLRELSGGWCELALGTSLSGTPRRGLCPLAYVGPAVAGSKDTAATGGEVQRVASSAAVEKVRARSGAARRSWSPASSLDDAVASKMAQLKSKTVAGLRPQSLSARQVESLSANSNSRSRRKSDDTVTVAVTGAQFISTSTTAEPGAAVPSSEADTDDEHVGNTVNAIGADTVAAPAGKTDLSNKQDVALPEALAAVTAAVDIPSAAVNSPTSSVGILPAAADTPLAAMNIPLAGVDSLPTTAVLRPRRPVPAPPMHRTSSMTRLVPTRAAPPVPKNRRLSLVSSHTITASTEAATILSTTAATAVCESSEENAHAITDLENKISILDDDIKRMSIALEHAQANKEAHSPEALQETVDFLVSNINGLTMEATELRENLRQLQVMSASENSTNGAATVSDVQAPEAAEEQALNAHAPDLEALAEQQKEKMKEQREKVIEEIRSTEESYLRDLHLCLQYFLSPDLAKHPDIDMEALLGNMEEVAQVSQKFLSAFENSVCNKTFEEQNAGSPFVILADEMKKAYSLYCRNHDDTCILLEKYEEDESAQAYFNSILDKLRLETVVFNVGSFLIKPVQRILKYPLLLKELLKCTDDSHPDKVTLLQAFDAVTDVASAINEEKRRKDLVHKYRKEKYATLTDKMALLNMHTLKKKSARLGSRLTATLGLSNQTKDPNFDREESAFRTLERTIKCFVKNVVAHSQLLEKAVSAQEQLAVSIRELYQERPTEPVLAYVQTQQMLVGDIFKNFKSIVDLYVVYPLNKLTGSYQGPSNIIQKRGDKLLDYDNCQYAFEKVKDTDQAKVAKEELQVAQKDYEALNEQLLVDLPVLNQLSSLIFSDAVAYYLRAYRQYLSAILSSMYPLLQMPSLSTQGRQVMDCFTPAHEAIAATMATVCGAAKSSFLLSPAGASELQLLQATTTRVQQTEETRQLLLAKYPTEQLCIVTASHSPAGYVNAGSSMELSVAQGQLVAVLKTKDPTGSSDKWFVDNGATKGFVPRHHLRPMAAADVCAAALPASQVGHGKQRRLSEGGYAPIRASASLRSSPQTSPRLDPGAQAAHHERALSLYNVSSSAADSAQQQQGWQNACSIAVAPLKSPPSPPVTIEVEHWYALYSFVSRGSSEASLIAGQPVTVFQKQDLSGNASWWLVDCCGHYGYAPSNYLAPCEPQAASLPPAYQP